MDSAEENVCTPLEPQTMMAYLKLGANKAPKNEFYVTNKRVSILSPTPHTQSNAFDRKFRLTTRYGNGKNISLKTCPVSELAFLWLVKFQRLLMN